MRLTWNELQVPLDADTMLALLDEWTWLVDDTFLPILVTAAGDMILEHDSGKIVILDTASGQLAELADDVDAFHAEVVRPENANQWLMAQFVGDALSSGIELGPEECLSYETPPVLGGKVDLENVHAEHVVAHFSVMGQIHAQVKDLPPGTPIGNVRLC